MLLTAVTPGRTAFCQSAIMHRAFQLGRYAFQLCRTATDRNHERSHWLKRAWSEAKLEAREVVRRMERDAEMRLALAERAKDNAALAASFGNDPSALECAILRETMRDQMNFTAVARLEAALAAILATEQLH